MNISRRHSNPNFAHHNVILWSHFERVIQIYIINHIKEKPSTTNWCFSQNYDHSFDLHCLAMAGQRKLKEWAKFELQLSTSNIYLLQFKIHNVTCHTEDFESWYIRTHTKEKPIKISNITFAILHFYKKIRSILWNLLLWTTFMQPSMGTLNPPSSRVVKDSTPSRRWILRYINFGIGESSPILFLDMMNLYLKIFEAWWILNERAFYRFIICFILKWILT